MKQYSLAKAPYEISGSLGMIEKAYNPLEEVARLYRKQESDKQHYNSALEAVEALTDEVTKVTLSVSVQIQQVPMSPERYLEEMVRHDPAIFDLEDRDELLERLRGVNPEELKADRRFYFEAELGQDDAATIVSSIVPHVPRPDNKQVIQKLEALIQSLRDQPTT